MATRDKPLNARQEAFCLNVVSGKSFVESATLAGYALAFVGYNVSHILESTRIRERIAQLHRRVVAKTIGNARERQEILTDIYRAKLTDFIDEEGNPVIDKANPTSRAISEYSVSTRYTKRGDRIVEKTIKVRDPVPSIDTHNKMDRLYAQEAPREQEVHNTFVFILPDGTKIAPQSLIEGSKERKQDIIPEHKVLPSPDDSGDNKEGKE